MTKSELTRFISRNTGSCIEFGTQAQAPSTSWIAKTEEALGLKLPSDYRWFLENYGGGEIHGDEIYSIYECPLEEVSGGDVVAMTLQGRRNGSIQRTDILICNTDFGESFVLGCSNDDLTRVDRIVGKRREEYAASFAEFILAYVGDAAV